MPFGAWGSFLIISLMLRFPKHRFGLGALKVAIIAGTGDFSILTLVITIFGLGSSSKAGLLGFKRDLSRYLNYLLLSISSNFLR